MVDEIIKSNEYEFLKNIDESERLNILSSIIKFRDYVPTIEEFIKDDYYLGKVVGDNLYPYWLDVLKEIYPNPYETKTTIIFKGAIGCGKTFATKIMIYYDLAKLLLMENPEEFFGIKFEKGVAIKLFSVDKDKANKTMVAPIWSTLYSIDIPFFNEFFVKKKHKKVSKIKSAELMSFKLHINSAKTLNDLISEDVFTTVLSELNFIKRHKAEKILSQVYSRLYSRFKRGLGLFNHVIIDSSDTSVGSVVETFIKESPYAKSDKCLIYSTPIWEAKKHLGLYFNRGYFYVYAGDAETPAFILEKDPYFYENLDQDRIIKVPDELRDMYEADLELALKDTAGISIFNNSLFFTNETKYENAFSLPNATMDEITLDFFDNSTLMEYVRDAIDDLLPIDRKIYARLDLGLVHDNAGIALGYADSYQKKKVGDKEVELGTYKIPIAFSLSRLPEQETCISKIFEFFVELSQMRHLELVTTDQYQSSQLRQDLERLGIKTKLLSVDRNTEAYAVTKRLMYEGRLKLCNNPILKWEGKNLILFKGKVDHQSFSSKDIFDAVAGVVKSMVDDGDKALDPSTIKSGEIYVDILNRMYSNEIRTKMRYGIR